MHVKFRRKLKNASKIDTTIGFAYHWLNLSDEIMENKCEKCRLEIF